MFVLLSVFKTTFFCSAVVFLPELGRSAAEDQCLVAVVVGHYSLNAVNHSEVWRAVV